MDILFKVILAILVLLATFSGITKIMLMQQDIDFFGAYGFNNPMLITYGAVQLTGGIMMIIKKTRFIGSAIVATTFITSTVILIMAEKIPVAIVTFIAISLLGMIMKKSIQEAHNSTVRPAGIEAHQD